MPKKKTFDDNELSILNNVEILQYREIAYKKVNQIMREVKDRLEPKVVFLNHVLPKGTLTQGGKISKGENLLGLPYIVLDYPRYKSGNELMLFRTMFWWGNYFSATLHLQGELARSAFANLPNVNFHPSSRFSVDEDWNHDINSYQYDCNSILQKDESPRVLKIAQTIPLINSNDLPDFSLLCYETWIELIHNANL